jgi:hypothetical protein
MMANREQIAASANEMLLSSGSTSVFPSGMLKDFSTMSMFWTTEPSKERGHVREEELS